MQWQPLLFGTMLVGLGALASPSLAVELNSGSLDNIRLYAPPALWTDAGSALIGAYAFRPEFQPTGPAPSGGQGSSDLILSAATTESVGPLAPSPFSLIPVYGYFAETPYLVADRRFGLFPMRMALFTAPTITRFAGAPVGLPPIAGFSVIVR